MEAKQRQRVEMRIPAADLKRLAVGDKTYGSPCDFRVTEADLAKARRELNETEEIRKAALLELKGMLSGDTDFKYRTDDDYLLCYLRYRKFKTKEAYKFIQNFYKTREKCPEIFRVPPNMEQILDSGLLSLMPYTDDDGDFIFVIKPAQWNPSEISLAVLLQMFCCTSEIFALNPHAQINGGKGIWDFGGTTVSHFTALVNPANLKLWTMVMQELYPWRVKRCILVNCRPIVRAGYATARIFLKKKIAERIVLLGSDMSEVHEYINPAVLPKEYGGNLEDDECHSYIKNPLLANLLYLKHSFSDISAL